MTVPRVTVLMSVYNGENYLGEAIDSILNQSFTDFEFIIINDGCTDSSRDVITSYSDHRIRLIDNQRNIGLTRSLNKGLELAQGEYIVRMDADDISLSKRIEKQVSFMHNNLSIDVCGSWIKYFRNGNKIVFRSPSDPEEIKANLFFRNIIFHPTVIFRKKLPNGDRVFYNENYLRAQDYELWSRISQLSNISNINEVLVKHRSHENTIFKTDRKGQIEAANKVRFNQLVYLGIDTNDEEIQLHYKWINKKFPFSIDLLNQTNKWFQKLRAYNNKFRIYNSVYFEKLLYDYWFLVCTSSTENGIKVYNLYKSTNVGMQALRMDQKVKLLIKCLVKC
tara:strand:+ start:498 stop:1505 length:1008 start_codon:yes stop_codon:yes gene_type:complete